MSVFALLPVCFFLYELIWVELIPSLSCQSQVHTKMHNFDLAAVTYDQTVATNKMAWLAIELSC